MIMRVLNLFAATVLVSLCGCQSTFTNSASEGVEANNDVIISVPSVGDTLSSDYLNAHKPLNVDFIALPFLFDGDVVLKDGFDVATWRNKRFISNEGGQYTLQDTFMIDMDKGNISSINGSLEFQGLKQSLLIKVLPLKGSRGLPRHLVVRNMREKEGGGSILIIEDPVTMKIHGFIESAIIDYRF